MIGSLFGNRKNRGRRTLFLGVLATGTFVWAAIDRFGVPPEEMARLMLYCVMGVLLTMVLAALSVGIFVGGRLLLRRLGVFRTPPE